MTRPLIKQTTGNNIKFCCKGQKEVTWNGLPYLASMSTMLKARSGEEQRFIVFMPEYDAGIVKKLLRLITVGEVKVDREEVKVISQLARDLGVRLNECISVPMYVLVQSSLCLSSHSVLLQNFPKL